MANYLGLAVKEMGIIYHIKPKEVIYFGFFFMADTFESTILFFIF